LIVPFIIQPEFSPGAPGGVCFVCKSARRWNDVVVDCIVDPDDLNWTVPTSIPGMAFELAAGSLEICSTCWTEAAQELGMINAEQAERLRTQVAKLENDLELVTETNRVLEDAVYALRRVETLRQVGDDVFGEDTK
jgi:hypothetical protein